MGTVGARFKMAANGLRLCDGCEALELSVGAACTKPLLAAGLSHK